MCRTYLALSDISCVFLSFLSDTSSCGHNWLCRTYLAGTGPLDLTLDNPTDRVHFQLCTLPTALRTTIIHHGPCRLEEPFSISSENGNIQIFSEKHYHAHSGAMEIERQRLCFSPTTKKPYFQRCWLFGDPSEMRKEWANCVPGNPKNFGVKIKSHEETQSHLDASIAFGQRKAGQRIDRIQEQTSVVEATFWRMCLLRTINIFMALAMMSLTREPRTRGRWRLPRWKLPRSRGDASVVRPGPAAGSTSNPSE